MGDPKTALKDKFSVVITEEIAGKFFANENPIGKAISVDGRYFGGDYFVSGVAKDVLRNSSLDFDVVTSTVHNEIPLTAWERWQPNTSWRPVQTFVMLSDVASPKNIDIKLQALLSRYMGSDVRERNRYILQPLARMYLYSNSEYGIRGGGDIMYVYIFSAIAIFIAFIAGFNFVNLSIARSATRSKEIGVGKTVGAHKHSLVFQFLAEAIFMAFCSALLTFCLVEAFLPYLDTYIDREVKLAFGEHLFLFCVMFLTALVIGTVSGLYPALFMASFFFVQILRRDLKFNTSRNWLRSGSLVFQFAASVVLIISTLVVYEQMAFIQNKALGFDKARIVFLPLFGTDRSLNARYRVIKQEFLKHPQVISASASNSTMAWFGGAFHTVYPEGFQGGEWQMRILGVDEDFIELYGITLSRGRNFSAEISSDATDAYILNETAVEQLGWEDPIGKQFEWAYWKRKGVVIGVVADFHNRSLKEPIMPIALCMWQPKYNLLAWCIAYFFMDNWLLSFAYRIELSPSTFAIGSLFAIAVTFATVAWHLIQAASKNLIDEIRYE